MSNDTTYEEDLPAAPRKAKKKRTPRKITQTYLQNSGMYYLQRFAASEAHFKSVMMRKIKLSVKHHGSPSLEEAEKLLDTMIKDFVRLELLNDELYARGLVNSLRRSGKSQKAIFLKMTQKGVPSCLIEQSLDTYSRQNEKNADQIEREAAETFARKKKIGPYRHLRLYTPRKTVIKQMEENGSNSANNERSEEQDRFRKELAMFARAGFSYAIAQEILSEDIE